MNAAEVGRETARRPVQALLAAALLAVTALVRVPTQLYDSSRQDFSGASGEVLLILFGSGLLLFLALTLAVVRLPPRLQALASAVLVGLAIYAWTRASLFPGPSVSLDGRRLTTDLSTGAAGLAVPLAAALLLAGLGRRQPRVVVTVLAVLLGGSLLQSLASAASAWRAAPRESERAASALLEWSRQGNVLVYILDTLQADVFEDVLEAEPGLREKLDGFRLYRGAASNSPTTYLSLPTIHSGRRYDSTRPASRFYEESIHEGSVLNRFADAGYQVSYAMGLGPCPREVASCLSTPVLGRSRRAVATREAAHLLDLGLYRVLPDGMRAAVLQRDRGVLAAMAGKTWFVDRTEGEVAALERLASSLTVSDSPPTAKMVHTMVTHLPAVLRSDCSTGARRFDRPGAIAQARCAFRPVVALLERLQAEGIYDVSDILLISDHGYGFSSAAVSGTRDWKFRQMVGALNPTVLVKPAGERGPLVISDAPIELTDLARALCGETGCRPSEGLRDLAHVEADRPRQAFWYNWKHRYWGLPQIPGLTEYSIRGDLARAESWFRKAAAYTPGTRLDFRRGRQDSARYLGVGWGRRTPAHQAMADAQATLRLQASFDGTREYEIALDARLIGASPGAPERVSVRVNEVSIGELAPDRAGGPPGSYRLEVPVAVLLRSPETTVTFAVEPTHPGGDTPSARLALRTLELRARP